MLFTHNTNSTGKDSGSEEKATPAPEKTTTQSPLGGGEDCFELFYFKITLSVFGDLLSRFQESDNPLARLFGNNNLSNLAEQFADNDALKRFQQVTIIVESRTRQLSIFQSTPNRITFTDLYVMRQYKSFAASGQQRHAIGHGSRAGTTQA